MHAHCHPFLWAHSRSCCGQLVRSLGIAMSLADRRHLLSPESFFFRTVTLTLPRMSFITRDSQL